MKQITFLFLYMSIVQLLILVLCGVEGYGNQSDRNSNRDGRGVKKAVKAATKSGSKTRQNAAGTVELEEICFTHDECKTGFCCLTEHFPAVYCAKTCHRQVCCSTRGRSSQANPRHAQFSFRLKNYRLYIKNIKHWVDASVECATWAPGGRLAAIESEDEEQFIQKEIENAMTHEQNRLLGSSYIQSSVYLDGIDVDNLGNYTNVFRPDFYEQQFLANQFAAGEPKTGTFPTCAALRFYDTSQYWRIRAIDCQRLQPFLCEAPI